MRAARSPDRNQTTSRLGMRGCHEPTDEKLTEQLTTSPSGLPFIVYALSGLT
jgi:hypothetical protein